MATRETTRLCTWIIRSYFGNITSAVADTLATRGRLSFRDLVFFTKLSPRIIRGAILVLVQHDLLWHSTSDGDEIFELIVEDCFMRLRFGKYTQIAQDLFGDEGAEVVQIILDHGRIRLPDICTRLPRREPTACAKTLQSLIKRHLVKSTTEYLNQSRADRISGLERELISEDADTRKTAVVAAKKLTEKRSAASFQVRRLEEDAESLGLTKTSKDASSKRRGVKKEKHPPVDQGVWFRINFSKFNVYYRNTLIKLTVQSIHNEHAAQVMQAILRASEDDQLSLADIRSQPLSSHRILDELSPIISKDELSSGLASKSGIPSSMADLVRDYIAILSASDNPTSAGRAAAFISTGPSGGAGKVQIEFENIYHRLRLSVLEGYVRERWGPLAVRVTRILAELGNVDEKHFTKVGLLAPSEVRPIVSELQTAGIIELKEVPKGKDLAPSRTFYFWHLDLRKAYAVLLSSLTNTLANLLERQAAESSHPAFELVLEKRERTDVAEDQDLLTRPEKELLQEWDERMMRLTAAAGRVDEAVFVLRDLGMFS